MSMTETQRQVADGYDSGFSMVMTAPVTAGALIDHLRAETARLRSALVHYYYCPHGYDRCDCWKLARSALGEGTAP